MFPLSPELCQLKCEKCTNRTFLNILFFKTLLEKYSAFIKMCTDNPGYNWKIALHILTYLLKKCLLVFYCVSGTMLVSENIQW